MLHLVVHQGDQGRDNQRQSGMHHRRKLPTQALARAGGQDTQCVPAGKQGLHRRFLTGTVMLQPEGARQVTLARAFQAMLHQNLRPPPPWLTPPEERCTPLPPELPPPRPLLPVLLTERRLNWRRNFSSSQVRFTEVFALRS